VGKSSVGKKNAGSLFHHQCFKFASSRVGNYGPRPPSHSLCQDLPPNGRPPLCLGEKKNPVGAPKEGAPTPDVKNGRAAYFFKPPFVRRVFRRPGLKADETAPNLSPLPPRKKLRPWAFCFFFRQNKTRKSFFPPIFLFLSRFFFSNAIAPPNH